MNSSPSTSPLGRAWQGLADREAARLRDRFVQDARTTVSSRLLLAYLLSALILLGAVLMWVLGFWFLTKALNVGASNGYPRLTNSVAAFLLLAIAWLARPHFPKLPGQQVAPEQAPELHALIKDVAAQLKVAPPAQVTLQADVNAFMGNSGFPPRSTLGIGLPLWYGLPPQARAAILAHELAHQRNHDPARTQLIATALTVLQQLYRVIMPDDMQRTRTGILERITNTALTLLAQVPYGLYLVLLNLIGEAHQAAEFRADLLAARVAGTPATAQALELLHYGEALESALHKQRHFPERANAFLELQHIWATMSVTERQKRQDELKKRRARLDDSHPPTSDRIQVVQAHPAGATLNLLTERTARIDAELNVFVKPLEQQAYAEYRARYDG